MYDSEQAQPWSMMCLFDCLRGYEKTHFMNHYARSTHTHKNSGIYVHGSVHREPMSINIQQDATLYSFYTQKIALHILGDIFTHYQDHE
jgi:hypothetical protein